MYSLINLSQIDFFVLLQEKTLWNLLWIFLFYFNDYILQCKFYFFKNLFLFLSALKGIET